MRISDWSSDVCSSDLLLFSRGGTDDGIRATLARADRSERGDVFGLDRECVSLLRFIAPDFHRRQRRISGLHVAQLEVAAATVGIEDRQSVVEGKSGSVSGDLGGRRILQQKKIILYKN